MIEAPEARILAGQIHETLCGKRMEEVVAGFTPHKFAFFNESLAATEKVLRGETILCAEAVGGQVKITAANTTFVFSDGCNVRYIEPGVKLPAKHQLLIGFDDNSALTFSVQMYGMMWAYRGEPDHPYYRMAVERPNVFSQEFTPEYFTAMATVPELQKKSVKALLATEQRIPGLGNGVLQDILLAARIHPQRKVSSLSGQEIGSLYDSIVSLNREMYRLGGRHTETDLFGRRGGYLTHLTAKSLGEPCPVCGGAIERKAYLGGNIYYCTDCQPL